MTPAQIAYMLVSLGYPDEGVVETLRPLPDAEARELVRMAHTERATNLAEQDAAIAIERQAARHSEAVRGG